MCVQPHPFLYQGSNYLLTMCEDLDFLDQADDLVAWLGFRLVRNPFVVCDALDTVVSEKLAVDVRKTRALGYWTRPKAAKGTKGKSAKTKTTAGEKSPTKDALPKQQASRPHHTLVTPLVGIMPEDDPVDGTRLARAQRVLLDDEACYGRWASSRVILAYLDAPDASNCSNGAASTVGSPLAVAAAAASPSTRHKHWSVYDEGAILAAEIKSVLVCRAMTTLSVFGALTHRVCVRCCSGSSKAASRAVNAKRNTSRCLGPTSSTRYQPSFSSSLTTPNKQTHNHNAIVQLLWIAYCQQIDSSVDHRVWCVPCVPLPCS